MELFLYSLVLEGGLRLSSSHCVVLDNPKISPISQLFSHVIADFTLDIEL